MSTGQDRWAAAVHDAITARVPGAGRLHIDGQPAPCDLITESLDQVCRRNGWEFVVTLETATDCAWTAEIKVITRPHSDGPDRGRTVYAAGGTTPEDALARAWEELAAWTAEETWPQNT